MHPKCLKNLQVMLYVAKKCNSRPGCTSWHHRMATKTRHEEEMPSGFSEPAVCCKGEVVHAIVEANIRINICLYIQAVLKENPNTPRFSVWHCTRIGAHWCAS